MRLAQKVAHRAVGGKALLAASLDRGRVVHRPEFDLARHGAGKLDRLVLRLGRKRDDEIVGCILERLEHLRLVRGYVDADLGHDGDGEGIEMPLAHAHRVDKDATGMQLPQHRSGHGRADRIEAAGEEHARRQPRHGLTL